ncbi:MAG TPA: tetratricopeptide repeat protein [Rudaea sp.]|nr:tetratricopeptide repeat protein [Rudaea sp.]
MRNLSRMIVTIGVAVLLGAGVAHAAKKDEKNEYPNATRAEPKLEMSSGTQKDLNKALDLVNDSKYDEAQPILQKVLGDSRASKYARALALEAEGQIASGKQDDEAAIKNFRDAYALDALPNSQQFQVLYNVAIIQIQSEKYQDALNTLNEWFKVTGAQKAEAYALQGNAYYRLEQFQPAVDAIKKALSLSDKPNDSWYQILMASYAELEQYDEAAKVLEQQLAKNPNDVKLTTQLATVYIKGKQDQKAVDLLVAAKQKGLLTSESDYKLMAQLYDQLDKPKEAAAVLSEGFTKGIVKPSYEMYKLLGDSYALATDDAHAIEAYGKASGFSKDGNVDYVRGSLLMNNDRGKEAVEALRQAVAKGGLKQPGEAYILLGDAENGENNAKAAAEAWEKAKAYPSTRQMAEQRLKSMKGGKGPVIKRSKP